jgi:hypothetical protein
VLEVPPQLSDRAAFAGVNRQAFQDQCF